MRRQILIGSTITAFLLTTAYSLPGETAVQNFTGSKTANSTVGSTSAKKKGRKRILATPIFEEHCDPLTSEMSPDAVQLAEILGIDRKLRRLMEINETTANASSISSTSSTSSPASTALREEKTDLKFDILDTVEETRLQMDFVFSEVDEEQVILEEGMRIFSEERDARVNRANLWAFRTNGVLWAVAEALDIPTYKSPTLSIPSGAIGIVAGIVPSVFSAYATRHSSGGKLKREFYPNIMTKLYDFPTIPRVEFPDVVWQWLNAKPDGETRNRRQIMIDHWRDDTNIHIFKGGINRDKLKLLTGNSPYVTDMELISDKLLMMGQIKSVTLQMSRPLLEICMAARGKKHFVRGEVIRND